MYSFQAAGSEHTNCDSHLFVLCRRLDSSVSLDAGGCFQVGSSAPCRCDAGAKCGTAELSHAVWT